jgi:hypothetical protein
MSPFLPLPLLLTLQYPGARLARVTEFIQSIPEDLLFIVRTQVPTGAISSPRSRFPHPPFEPFPTSNLGAVSHIQPWRR